MKYVPWFSIIPVGVVRKHYIVVLITVTGNNKHKEANISSFSDFFQLFREVILGHTTDQ